MTVRWGALGAAAFAAMLVLAGCGLPSGTDPKYAGPARSAAPPVQDAAKPPTPQPATSAVELVRQYLEAGVLGNLDTDDESSPNTETRVRLRQFMTPGLAKSWTAPPGELIIVHDMQLEQTQVSNGVYTVSANINPIGTLNDRGEFDATQKPDPSTVYFAVQPTPSGDLRLNGVPPHMYLVEKAFKEWYEWQPIYFWEATATAARLVPDMRYMPTTLPPVKQVSEVMRWLKLGPGQWLGGVVKGLPDDVESKGSPVQLTDPDSATWRINLSSKAAGLKDDDLSRLARQIRWSLRNHPLVQLAIEGQPNAADSTNGFTDDNAAHTLFTATDSASSASEPEKFCVANGSVRAVVVPSSGETPLFAPGTANTQVVSAAINRQYTRAALVRQVGKAEQTLLVGQTGSADPAYRETSLARVPHLSRPAWMNYPSQRLLVSDGQQLWTATTAVIDDSTHPVPTLERVTQGGLATPPAITAFAVAPEGHRIALIAGGTVMVASLQETNDNKLTMGAPRPITTSLGDNEGVAWLTETTLVVGGKPSSPQPNSFRSTTPVPYSVVGITLDGADETPLPARATTASQMTVDAVVALAGDPLVMANQSWLGMRVSVMVEANHVAREVFVELINPLNFGGPPSPSADPAVPTSPFYPD